MFTLNDKLKNMLKYFELMFEGNFPGEFRTIYVKKLYFPKAIKSNVMIEYYMRKASSWNVHIIFTYESKAASLLRGCLQVVETT